MRAIILSSGGLDSTTCLSIALDRGYKVYPLTFLYGQKHKKEIKAAQKIRNYLNIPKDNHFFIKIDRIGKSALTCDSVEIPTKETDGIPDTYVPARNIIFLSYATSLAEEINADAIFIGVSSVDYSGYPDCRPKFINSIQNSINLGTKQETEIEIKVPLINLSKSETIKKGLELNTPYHLTTTCYNGGQKACGECPSCKIRLKAFEEIGIKDPIEYRNKEG